MEINLIPEGAIKQFLDFERIFYLFLLQIKKCDKDEKPTEKFDRPRVYKCPEVSLDDIADKKIRDMIIKYMYTSETKNAIEESMKDRKHLFTKRTGLENWVSSYFQPQSQ